MKKTKIALTLVCAILLVAASVMGTLAYLTATTDTVTNTFTVGKVSFVAGAGLDEAKVNTDGELLDTTDKVYTNAEGQTLAKRVTSNTYKLVPGHEYVKDPTVHMGTDSEDCYLFVKVVNPISDIEDSTNTLASQMIDKGWKAVGNNYDNIYVYVGTTSGATTPAPVSKGTDIVVFEKFKIASNADVSGYANTKIEVIAYAVQADGFEDKTAVQILDAAFPSLKTPVDPEPAE